MLWLLLGSLFVIAGAAFFFGWLYPKLIVDELRDDLYCARHTLCGDILESGDPITHPEYLAMRQRINGLIAVSGSIDFFTACLCAQRVRPSRSPVLAMESGVPEGVRRAVEKAEREVDAILKRFLFKRCPSGFLISPVWHRCRSLWAKLRRLSPGTTGIDLVVRAVGFFVRPLDADPEDQSKSPLPAASYGSPGSSNRAAMASTGALTG